MILNRRLPHNPFLQRRLPGVQPLGDPWLYVSDTHAAQMAARRHLIATARDDVIWAAPQAAAAVDEMLDMVIDALPDGYTRQGDSVIRADGYRVPLDRADPLATLGHLVQEDFCLMMPDGGEHALQAAVLCFPSSWRLREKAGRRLVSIHVPVPEYDASIAARVQRLFDGVQIGRPLTRNNLIWADRAVLYNPKTEFAHHYGRTDAAPYLRTERQCLVRLPRSGGVVFSIHTFLMDRAGALALQAAAAVA